MKTVPLTVGNLCLTPSQLLWFISGRCMEAKTTKIGVSSAGPLTQTCQECWLLLTLMGPLPPLDGSGQD